MKRNLGVLVVVALTGGCLEMNPLHGDWTDGGITADGTGSPIDAFVLAPDGEDKADGFKFSCSPPASQNCYTGDYKTRGVGECRDGIQQCVSPGNWGQCDGEIKPADEVCDGKDNNCDGTLDENPSKLCNLANSVSTCTGGACAVSSCTTGFHDIDGNPANGCEYACAISMGAVDVCDGKDNNCDGEVDEHCSNLVLYLSGDLSYGSPPAVLDYSGRKHWGILYPNHMAGPKSVTGGINGKTFQFDGKDDYIQIGDHPDFQAMKSGFTVMMWVRPEKVKFPDFIFWKNDDSPAIRVETTEWMFLLSSSGGVKSSSLIQLKSWSHLAMTYNGTSLCVFINGKLEKTATSTFAPGGIIRVGGDGLAGRFFQGLIDEVLVYTTALTTSEIAAYYQATSAP